MSVLQVVLAEDDSAIRALVAHHLASEGFEVTQVADGNMALRAARTVADLLILDLGLPGIDGFEIARTLRRECINVPIIMLTARNEEIDRVIGLELGADDYVCKPFAPRELIARVKAVIRRCVPLSQHRAAIRRFGRLEIDESAREARVDGVDVRLKPREFVLLATLAANPGVALSRRTLLEKAWGFDFTGEERTVDVHVRRVRRALEGRYHLPPMLQTVHGFGYKFLRQ